MRILPAQVYLEDTGTRKGRGVFAAKTFDAGEIVEVCPVVPFAEDWDALPTEVRRVVFSWGFLSGRPEQHGLALGYASMYNHNNPANLRYQADAANAALRFVAVRAIEAAEELTVNYNAHGGGAEWNDDAWFERMGVELLAEDEPGRAIASAMQVHGACHCGAVAFEASADPERVTICHCMACQSLSGSAYRITVAASAEGFRLVRGSPKIYVKRGDSGNPRALASCAECGSPLYSHAAVDDPKSYGLRVGCLRERAALVPSKRIWCRSALPWSADLRGMTELEQQ